MLELGDKHLIYHVYKHTCFLYACTKSIAHVRLVRVSGVCTLYMRLRGRVVAQALCIFSLTDKTTLEVFLICRSIHHTNNNLEPTHLKPASSQQPANQASQPNLPNLPPTLGQLLLPLCQSSPVLPVLLACLACLELLVNYHQVSYPYWPYHSNPTQFCNHVIYEQTTPTPTRKKNLFITNNPHQPHQIEAFTISVTL